MTTEVKVIMTKKHLPVIVEVCYPNGELGEVHTLKEVGDSTIQYVHSGQTLRVREMPNA